MEMNLTFTGKRRRIVRFLLMSLLSCMLILPAQAQDRVTVSGRLTDTGQNPLIGASVIERGTTNGVTTDVDGRYQISVAKNATLDFSFVGYKTQSVAVANRTQIDVTLEEDAMMIGEVVAIGYGSQRKEDLSMAVTTVKVDEGARSRAADLGTLLQGRMPGVTILQSGGDPMRKASFSIRGRGSKGNDDDPTSGDGVLVVVDGVPNAPYSVEDVETVTVLKDAASAAIYGASVGSSGVILITTRKAEAGKMRVNVNAAIGVQKAMNLPNMLNARQYCDVWAKAVGNSVNGSLPNLANPEVYAGADVTRTDWLDEIFRTGMTQHYGISLSGGTEKISSILSVTYDKKEGTIMNTWSESLGAKLHTDLRPTKWLKVSEHVSFEYLDGQGKVNRSHTGPILGAMWFPSSASVYDRDAEGNIIYDDKGKPKYGGIASSADMAAGVTGPNVVNPVAQLETMHSRAPKMRFFSTTSFEVKPVRGLTLKSDFTADLDVLETDAFQPVIDVPGGSTTTLREQEHTRTFHYLWETTATYAEVFGKHHISAMAGFTTDYKKLRLYDFRTQNYPSDTWDKYQNLWQNGSWYRDPTENYYEYAMVSFLARLGYSFDDRYFLTASIRRDASSKLPSSKNYDWFPAVSGAWKLSSEKFFANSSLAGVFDLIKIRAGWGMVGNVDLYPNTSSVDVPLSIYPDGSLIGGNTVYGSYYDTIANPGATWETTVQTSAGIDLTLLKNTLDISVDYYDKETRDLVDYVPTPPQMGVTTSPMGNMGRVTNKGWEFSVAYRNTAAQGKLNYSVWGNFSTNKSNVEEYGSQPLVRHENPNINSQSILYSGVGHPWYSYYIYRTDGIFRSQEEIDRYVSKNAETGEVMQVQPNAKVGDLKFIDTNGDGVITDADKVLTGCYTPKQTFSFGASLDWKGFDFSFMFQGVAGNYIYNGTKQMGMNGHGGDFGNLIEDVFDTWDFNPSGSKYPRLGLAEDNNGNYTKFSDAFLEKGDYLRLKNITLGYTLPKHIARHIGLTNGSLRVYVSIDNVATITGYSGIDPEVGNYGLDAGIYPSSRFFNFGVNLNF
ncbi:SusC/RagA family TonB-linked outer membrane protein [Alistipes senegalensis]|uniref:SusC/RagA family TonB-linked outer membrane protein n=1 Tax=Alistipes senegalensis TaxID=1288121 RepID=UPI00101D263D|nr:TonB-dependent receptor [Alistipes senegalensis]